MHNSFRALAEKASKLVGTAWAFAAALAIVITWAVLGPVFKFSDTWQLVINTGTTIITFLIVFLIQNTQNRQGKALQLKLDELIEAHTEARQTMIDIEDLSDDELDRLEEQFRRYRARKRPPRKNRTGGEVSKT